LSARSDIEMAAKALRILERFAHEVHCAAADAATDLELLAAEHEDGDQGEDEPDDDCPDGPKCGK
jgi:hypothetical protein